MVIELGKIYRSRGSGRIGVAALMPIDTEKHVTVRLFPSCADRGWTIDSHSRRTVEQDYTYIDSLVQYNSSKYYTLFDYDIEEVVLFEKENK